MRAFSSLLLLLLLLLPTSSLAFRTYPLFEQCDPRWGNDPMGVNGPGERSTICGEGCAMSSLAMVLAGLGIPVPVGGTPQPATPGTFNAWLEADNGYHCDAGDCNNLVLDVVSNLTGAVQFIGELPPPPIASIETGLTAGNVAYLAHVRNRTHFVLLTGFVGAGSGVFTVNDPNAHNTTYTYAEMADILMYALLEAGTAPTTATTPSPSLLRGAPRVASSPVVPFPYPLYKQCNTTWGNDVMLNETICAVGCLMSSTAMALAGHGITDAGVTIDPGTFNAWLRTHGGYEGQSDLIEDAVPAIDPAHVGWDDAGGMHRTNDVPFPQIQALVAKGQPVIANVLQGKHFVLVVGWDASDTDTLYVNDPGFPTLSYSYSKDVVGWRLFNMTQA
jgi:hypothetical protein